MHDKSIRKCRSCGRKAPDKEMLFCKGISWNLDPVMCKTHHLHCSSCVDEEGYCKVCSGRIPDTLYRTEMARISSSDLKAAERLIAVRAQSGEWCQDDEDLAAEILGRFLNKIKNFNKVICPLLEEQVSVISKIMKS